MFHVTYGDKGLVVGDKAALLLMEYAALLGKAHSADEVELHAIGSDGDEVTAIFLLNDGAGVMAETAHSNMPEPDNAEAIEYMTARIKQYYELPLPAFDDQH